MNTGSNFLHYIYIQSAMCAKKKFKRKSTRASLSLRFHNVNRVRQLTIGCFKKLLLISFRSIT